MASHEPRTEADQRTEAVRVSLIFGVLTLCTMLPMTMIIAVVLTVTTGQGTRGMVIGLIPAALLAMTCSAAVAWQTWCHLRPAAVPPRILQVLPE